MLADPSAVGLPPQGRAGEGDARNKSLWLLPQPRPGWRCPEPRLCCRYKSHFLRNFLCVFCVVAARAGFTAPQAAVQALLHHGSCSTVPLSPVGCRAPHMHPSLPARLRQKAANLLLKPVATSSPVSPSASALSLVHQGLVQPPAL